MLYPIFMLNIATQLEAQGFEIIKIAPNKKRPQFNVYYFKDTLELHKALTSIMKDR